MQRKLSALNGQKFDLLVCGGGIYGAWTALDASLRGLKVALVEQNDWASATSSSSTKLIHGGLRYLETLELHLVKKTLAERQLLLKLAPHRIWPLRFGIPLFQDGRLQRLKVKLGLKMYDTLASVGGTELSHCHLSKNDLLQSYPSLQPSGLLEGYSYVDAQTDDARLVLELVAGAQAAGAVCVNYCQLIDIVVQQGVAQSAKLIDQITEKKIEVSFSQLVCTVGQWSSRSIFGGHQCRLSKGVHLVLPGGLIEDALLLTARSDGRVFFIIPWYGQTLIGTTDRDFYGDVSHVDVEPEDIDYLLAEANFYLCQHWTKQDIRGCYAGLRVFKGGSHSSLSSASREWEWRSDDQGVIYSIGGKLTSARQDASRIVDEVCDRLHYKQPCLTDKQILPWTPSGDFASWQVSVANTAVQLGVDEESALWLARRHGKYILAVLELVQQDSALAQRIVESVPLIYADLDFCVQHEMVIHLDDLLRRRLPLLILASLELNCVRKLAERVGAMLGWSDGRVQLEVDSCRQLQSYCN